MDIEEGQPHLSSGEAIQPTTTTDANPAEPPFARKGDAELESGFNRMDPRSVTCEIVAGTILSSIFSIGAIVGLTVAYFGIDVPVIFWGLVGGATLFIGWLWFMTLIWPSRDYKYASWKLDESGIEYRKGVLWRHRVSVPMARVQHVDVSQGPLQRQFGLAELTIHTAGTQNSSVKVEGLAHPVAIQLRDELVLKRDHQGVDLNV